MIAFLVFLKVSPVGVYSRPSPFLLPKRFQDLPSRKLTKNYGTSPLLMGKSTVNGPVSIVFCMFTRPGTVPILVVFGILVTLVQEQGNAAMWRSIEQCHVDVMGRFDRELGQSPGGSMVMSSFNICRNSDSSADSAIKHHHKSSKSGIQHDIQPLRSSRNGS